MLLVLPNQQTQSKTAVFVGRLLQPPRAYGWQVWHGCAKHGTKPKANARFWRDKIACNRARDRQVNRRRRQRGWCVIRVWEHELKRKDEGKLVRKLRSCSWSPRRRDCPRGRRLISAQSWARSAGPAEY